MYARMYACMIEENRTHDHAGTRPAHQRNTGHTTCTRPEHTTTGKERNTGKAEKPEYKCMFAGNEKKVKKKLKKICK